MNFSTILMISLVVVGVAFVTVDAVSEPVCGYHNSQGETVFLKYLPYAKRGEDYVDFGADGKCVKRAVCTETFKTEVEDCSKYAITCANKNRYTGVFPGCCIKC